MPLLAAFTQALLGPYADFQKGVTPTIDPPPPGGGGGGGPPFVPPPGLVPGHSYTHSYIHAITIAPSPSPTDPKSLQPSLGIRRRPSLAGARRTNQIITIIIIIIN